MLVSFVGLLGFGVGFAFTSVWFWQVAAFSFATVFTQRFDLDVDLSVRSRAADLTEKRPKAETRAR